mmetsp:Transcript_9642/g.26218  ORF Transcript_9642/g.26218 Transcript_9642/m.26218 type:complete len:259 (-) Transcript_9642:1282-2058(-)
MHSVVFSDQSSSSGEDEIASGMLVTSLMANSTRRPICLAMALASPTTGLRRTSVSSRRMRSRRYAASDASRCLRNLPTDATLASRSASFCSCAALSTPPPPEARRRSSSAAISSRSLAKRSSSSLDLASSAAFSLAISSSTLSETVAPSASESSFCAKSQSMTCLAPPPSARSLAAATGSLKRSTLELPMMMRELCSSTVCPLISAPFMKVVPFLGSMASPPPSTFLMTACCSATPMPWRTIPELSSVPMVISSLVSQ